MFSALKATLVVMESVTSSCMIQVQSTKRFQLWFALVSGAFVRGQSRDMGMEGSSQRPMMSQDNGPCLLNITVHVSVISYLSPLGIANRRFKGLYELRGKLCCRTTTVGHAIIHTKFS